MDNHVITDAEFQQRAKAWADRVRAMAKANASAFPKGKKEAKHVYKTGRYAGKTEYKLSARLTYIIKAKGGDIDCIGFKMPVHGIFREYGVGNGQPRKGRMGRMPEGGYIKRSMSDWFHAPLERNIEEFSDLVAEYYGDKYLVNFRSMNTNRATHDGLI